MKIEKDINLSKYTTFQIGGAAKFYCEVKSKTELVEAVNFASENGLPIFILGLGSDILVNDNGIDGLVIKYCNSDSNFEVKNDKTFVTSGAGMNWDSLVEMCVERNLQGVECMSGIPGTVGAAPVQNIGAYGQELKDVFVSLDAYNIREKKFVKLNKDACMFGYRDSVFKSKDYWQRFIIVAVTIELSNNSNPDVKYESLQNFLAEKNIKNPTLKDVRASVLEIRKGKFEDYHNFPNAGSFFKNPIIDSQKLLELRNTYNNIPSFDNGDGTHKCFAGWFIEKAGWKGKKLGNAQVSQKHALILLNPQKLAKADEIKALANAIIDNVNEIFGIKLEPEVQYI